VDVSVRGGEIEAIEDPNGIPNTELGLDDDDNDVGGFVVPYRVCLPLMLSFEKEGVDATLRSSSGFVDIPGFLKICASSSRSFLILTFPP
jgi:hypothetical protein